MTLTRLRQIGRVEKVIALAADPNRERPHEAESAATLAAALIRDYQIAFVIASGTPIRLAKVRDSLQGGIRGALHNQVAPRDLRFAWGNLVHPQALALGQCCFFSGDYYVFARSGDVVLE